MIAWIAMSAIATCVIALYAYKSHQLASKIIVKNKQYQQEVSDLYTAIVISNLFCAGESTESKIQSFRKLYKGKTKIGV